MSGLSRQLHSTRCGDTYLAGALSAAVHGPFIFVLVQDAIVEANSTVDVHLINQQIAVLRLGDGKGGRERKQGCLGWRMENFHFAKVPAQMNH